LAATHSLKTPLFIITSFLNKIENNLKNNKESQMNSYYLNLVKESSLLNEKFSTDLISYLSLYNITHRLAFINLHTFIEKSINIYKLKYKEAIIVNQSESLLIYSNPILLEIIIHNIVDNGLKYNNSECPSINIYTKMEDSKLSIFFEDNGIGIGNDFLEKIFNPFNRINEIETTTGSGLGLTISKLAALKLNATLELLSSKKNEGTIFKLALNNEN
jgi:K+-sensing histidine kinase KdpD